MDGSRRHSCLFFRTGENVTFIEIFLAYVPICVLVPLGGVPKEIPCQAGLSVSLLRSFNFKLDTERKVYFFLAQLIPYRYGALLAVNL